jgi:hypothetical protein
LRKKQSQNNLKMHFGYLVASEMILRITEIVWRMRSITVSFAEPNSIANGKGYPRGEHELGKVEGNTRCAITGDLKGAPRRR